MFICNWQSMVALHDVYYTILSNMLVMFFMGDMVWRMVREVVRPRLRTTLRMKAVTILLWLPLSSTTLCWRSMTPEKFYRLENSLVIHRSLMFFDTLVIDKAKQYWKLDPFLWTLIPLLHALLPFSMDWSWKCHPRAKIVPCLFSSMLINTGWAFVGK